jgi:DNA-binding CsgD family transcriptional regulator
VTTPTVTPRQMEVLVAIDDGCATEEIAERLGISESTVKVLVRRLAKKFPGRLPDLPDNARRAGVTVGPPQE